MTKRTLFDRVVKLGVKAAVGTLVRELPPELQNDEARRLVESEAEEWILRNSKRAAEKVTEKVKGKVEELKKKRDERKSVEALQSLPLFQLKTACGVLGVKVPKKGKPVDLEKAAENRRELLKKYHPDRGGNREQFQAVNSAFELVEKYNAVCSTKGSKGTN